MCRVLAPLTVLIGALCLALTGWAGVRAVRNQPVVLRQLVAGGVVEAVLLVQTVVAIVLLARGASPSDPVTFWGYLLTTLLVLPVAAAWAFAERTRWSSVVLLVAGLTVIFLQLRLVTIWGAA